jgi:hypothetical protein
MSLLLLTISDERLQEGIQRMKDVGIRYGLWGIGNYEEAEGENCLMSSQYLMPNAPYPMPNA